MWEKKQILIFDTTLRDGAQGENISFSAEDKLRIAQRLDDIGVHYIEGGWPGSNPRDVQFFEMAKDVTFENAKLTAFGSTRKPNISCGEDPNLQALLDAETPAVAIFGKSWDLHVEKVLGTTLKENLAMIRESVAYFKAHGKEVIYDAEHFFDGYKNNPPYAMKTIKAAIDGGADFIVFCDTNGGTMTWEIEQIINSEHYRIDAKLGIHAHNDCGLAVSNTLAAVRCGAVMVQGTINGYGERTGNVDLTSVIPVLQLKMGLSCMTDENLGHLTELSCYVSEVANMTPFNGRPFVGKSAFAHKGGIHADAVMKISKAYEHITPERIGNKRRVLISDLSGKSNVEYKARELGVELMRKGPDSRKIALEIKRLEEQGYQFEAADGSFKILMEKFTKQFKPLFELQSFRVHIEKEKDRPCSAHAAIKISVDGTEEITAAEGDGPISALDNALRKALEKFYVTDLEPMRLVDFKVRVINGAKGTAAKVRVLIESRDEDDIWSTIGASEDIIEASWQALADSYQYKLAK